MFVPNQVYKRTNIHEMYGGQTQGGISTPSGHKLIFLFTGGQGASYGYHDNWEDGIFRYTGEGQTGNMQLKRGNKAVADHIAQRKDLHLFEYVDSGLCRYIGQMVYTRYTWREDVDRNGNLRQAIVFELLPIDAFAERDSPQDVNPTSNIHDLRQQALPSDQEGQSAVERRRIVYARSQAVRSYVLARAGGVCEACGSPAPFKRADGTPYLEPHHIFRLSDGGPDNPAWVGAVCPNCHREAHYGANRDQLNDRLREQVAAAESRIAEEIRTADEPRDGRA